MRVVGQRHFALVKEFVDSYVIVTTDRSTDRETAARHQLTLACMDDGQPSLSSHMNIVVNVVDIDDHSPQFTQSVYNYSLTENRQPLEVTFVSPSHSAALAGKFHYAIWFEAGLKVVRTR